MSDKIENFSFDDDFSDGEVTPFGEEFDSADVVNREIDITDPFAADFNESKLNPPKRHRGLLSESDIDSIINFSEDDRRNMHFSNKIDETASSEDTAPHLPHKDFLDYLVLPKISGTNTKVPHSQRLPSEYVQVRGEKIEISDDPDVSSHLNKPATVIVNRDELGEVESIEVVCRCGERTYIKFEFAGDAEKFDLTEVYNPIVENTKDLDYSIFNSRPKQSAPEVSDIFKDDEVYEDGTKEAERSNRKDDKFDIDSMMEFDFV